MSTTEPLYTDARLAGLRVALTGGTSGLGRALVRALTTRSARVAFVARTPQSVAATEREFAGSYGIVGDVASKGDIHRIALQMSGMLGGVDVLINNASSLGAVPLKVLGDTECEELELALATNVLGPFRLTKALLGSLAVSAREGRGGVVVNVSSDAAVNPYPKWGAYGASKAALAHLTRIWDGELAASGVYLLALDPGDMDTPLHALALPATDRSQLKSPAQSAQEIIDTIVSRLPAVRAAPAGSVRLAS